MDRRYGMGAATSQNGTPFDVNEVAKGILTHTAGNIAAAMLPAAKLSPMGSVPINGQSVAAGAGASTGISVQWPCNGFIVGIRATVRDGTAASMGGTLLAVQVNGQDNLFPSGLGQGLGFLSFAMISGSASFMAQYAVRRAFQQATNWVIYISNTTSGTIVADVAFDYINTSSPRV